MTPMFAGGVTPRKGVEYLIKCKDKKEDVLFVIVGDINLDKEYARRVEEYANKNRLRVKFTGFVPRDDLKALYSACDIFVLPSLEEGFRMSLTEAMAFRKALNRL